MPSPQTIHSPAAPDHPSPPQEQEPNSPRSPPPQTEAPQPPQHAEHATAPTAPPASSQSKPPARQRPNSAINVAQQIERSQRKWPVLRNKKRGKNRGVGHTRNSGGCAADPRGVGPAPPPTTLFHPPEGTDDALFANDLAPLCRTGCRTVGVSRSPSSLPHRASSACISALVIEPGPCPASRSSPVRIAKSLTARIFSPALYRSVLSSRIVRSRLAAASRSLE